MPDRSKVSLEDLLHLKRTERPAPEFWANFEQELRQKQLSALLEQRPWWQMAAQFLVRRAYIPIGAAAALTLTLVSIKHYAPAQGGLPQGVPAGADTAAPLSHSENFLVSVSSLPQFGSSALFEQQIAQVKSGVVQPVGGAAPAEDTETAAKVKLLASDSPSARSIAANFARLEQSEPDLISAVLGSRLSSPSRNRPDEVVVEMASLSSGVSKRSRLLASYHDRQASPEPSAPDIVRERLSRRLGNADFNDGLSRVGLRGDQVWLKF